MTATNIALAVCLLATVAGCRTMEASDATPRSGFVDLELTAFRDSVPIGPTYSLTLSRPTFTGTQIAELAHAMSSVVVDEQLPPVSSIPPEQLESFETAAATVEGRVWLTIEAGSQTVEFNYHPERPSILVGIINRQKPHFETPGVYPGIGRDAALEAAHLCGDELADSDVIEERSYLREPILERAPSMSYPIATGGTIEVTDHYHFVFGQAPNGILLGNSELTIDVDAHSGDCFRVEVAFIDSAIGAPVELIVSVDDAKAAVLKDAPATGGQKLIDEGRVLYWLEPGVLSAIVEPRFVSSYTVLSDSGMASRGVPFAVTLSQDPPVVVEY
jgi:hypothetical protein